MKLKELHESEEHIKLTMVGQDEERSVLSVVGQQPEELHGVFLCSYKKLTSLRGSPTTVYGDVFVQKNELASLEGAPSAVHGDFYLNDNRLASLQGIHKHIKYIGGELFVNDNAIRSHVLGVLRIKGLKRVIMDNKYVQNILNKYIAHQGDILDCQQEIIDKGFEDFAQL